MMAWRLLVQLVYHSVRLKAFKGEEEGLKINFYVMTTQTWSVSLVIITTTKINTITPGLYHLQKQEIQCCQTVEQTTSCCQAFPDQVFHQSS